MQECWPLGEVKRESSHNPESAWEREVMIMAGHDNPERSRRMRGCGRDNVFAFAPDEWLASLSPTEMQGSRKIFAKPVGFCLRFLI
jgi:hypothetical protein